MSVFNCLSSFEWKLNWFVSICREWDEHTTRIESNCGLFWVRRTSINYLKKKKHFKVLGLKLLKLCVCVCVVFVIPKAVIVVCSCEIRQNASKSMSLGDSVTHLQPTARQTDRLTYKQVLMPSRLSFHSPCSGDVWMHGLKCKLQEFNEKLTVKTVRSTVIVALQSHNKFDFMLKNLLCKLFSAKNSKLQKYFQSSFEHSSFISLDIIRP